MWRHLSNNQSCDASEVKLRQRRFYGCNVTTVRYGFGSAVGALQRRLASCATLTAAYMTESTAVTLTASPPQDTAVLPSQPAPRTRQDTVPV